MPVSRTPGSPPVVPRFPLAARPPRLPFPLAARPVLRRSVPRSFPPPFSPRHCGGDPAARRKLFFRAVPERPISPLRTSFVTSRPAAFSAGRFRRLFRRPFPPAVPAGRSRRLFPHGTAAATLLRGGNYFSGRCRKNQFPRFALPSSPHLRPPANPAAAAAVVPAPLPISSVNCKTLKYNLLHKRGVSVFDTPLLSNPLKISTLHFTPLSPSPLRPASHFPRHLSLRRLTVLFCALRDGFMPGGAARLRRRRGRGPLRALRIRIRRRRDGR